MDLDKKSEQFDLIRKPNVLINSKFKSTLLETKITSLSVSDYITQLPSEYIYDENGRRVITYTGTQLKKHLNAKSGAIYQQFKKVATAMRSRSMLIEDIDNNSWKVIGLISKADYDNGKLTITFEPEADEYILCSKNFTIMQKMLMMGFSSIYGYRLYELLNKDSYRLNDVRDVVEIYYTITELRFNLCTVNTDNPDIQEKMTRKNADLNVIYESVSRKDIVYPTYDAFKRNVIIVGQEQVNEKSDIHVEYKEDTSGVGGKVVGIWFYISYNKESEIYINDVTSVRPKQRLPQLEAPDNLDDLCDEVREYITNVSLKLKDIKTLLYEADYVTDYIRKAYDECSKTKEIPNFMGWMISCIRRLKDNEWSEPIKVIDGDENLAKRIDKLDEERKSPEINAELANKTWNEFKTKKDFNDFLEYIDIPLFILEQTLTVNELIQKYVSWKFNR